MTPLKELMEHHPRAGRVEWIGLRPARKQPLKMAQQVVAEAKRGLQGDHSVARQGGKRQVTLIQREHLDVVARLLGLDELDPALLRRNIVVSGINLFSLRRSRFRVGDALFEGTDFCHPCSRMEAALGFGGYNAMRGHGGITARVLESGTLRLGDAVEWQSASEDKSAPEQLH
ncbi:MAG: MOSC domain-containing protein [Myxococcota bacterium]